MDDLIFVKGAVIIYFNFISSLVTHMRQNRLPFAFNGDSRHRSRWKIVLEIRPLPLLVMVMP